MADDEEALERSAFLKIVRAMRHYASDASEEVLRWRSNFARLSPAHRELLSHHVAKHANADACISRNDAFFTALLDAFSGPDVPPHLRVPPLSLIHI